MQSLRNRRPAAARTQWAVRHELPAVLRAAGAADLAKPRARSRHARSHPALRYGPRRRAGRGPQTAAACRRLTRKLARQLVRLHLRARAWWAEFCAQEGPVWLALWAVLSLALAGIVWLAEWSVS
nr:MAG TPA: hypothetical protein [Caudoviricetes sp.]